MIILWLNYIYRSYSCQFSDDKLSFLKCDKYTDMLCVFFQESPILCPQKSLAAKRNLQKDSRAKKNFRKHHSVSPDYFALGMELAVSAHCGLFDSWNLVAEARINGYFLSQQHYWVSKQSIDPYLVPEMNGTQAIPRLPSKTLLGIQTIKEFVIWNLSSFTLVEQFGMQGLRETLLPMSPTMNLKSTPEQVSWYKSSIVIFILLMNSGFLLLLNSYHFHLNTWNCARHRGYKNEQDKCTVLKSL